MHDTTWGSITDADFARIRELIHRIAGIALADTKKSLVAGRLAARIRHCGLATFDEYYRLVVAPGHEDELQTMVDLLTTNETYFFREEAHFEFVAAHVLAARSPDEAFSVWSAASSTGEEPYTLAMVLAETWGLEAPWSILGSDISARALAVAARGQYWLDRTRGLSQARLRRHCLKGVRSQAGTFVVAPELRRHVRFVQVNLNRPLPAIGPFDLVLLRNVMIYFDQATRREVVARVSERLRPGGYFIVGHSESLNGVSTGLDMVRPTIYRKAGWR